MAETVTMYKSLDGKIHEKLEEAEFHDAVYKLRRIDYNVADFVESENTSKKLMSEVIALLTTIYKHYYRDSRDD
jgi:RNase adaptor protein for sRNA GlmZ degradation